MMFSQWWEMESIAVVESVRRVGPLRSSVIVIEQAAQSFSALNPSFPVDFCLHWNDQPVFKTLMIALLMIMIQRLMNAVPQGIFT
jgi:hypothetical protein